MLYCSDNADISAVKKDIAAMETELNKLSGQEMKYSAELKEQVADMDSVELMDARLDIRKEQKRSAIERVKAAYGEKYDFTMMAVSKQDVASLLYEEAKIRSVREQLLQKRY